MGGRGGSGLSVPNAETAQAASIPLVSRATATTLAVARHRRATA